MPVAPLRAWRVRRRRRFRVRYRYKYRLNILYRDISEAFEKRYNQFLKMNPDILEYYGSRGLDRLFEIDTGGETEVSYNNLRSALRRRSEWARMTGSPASPLPFSASSSSSPS
ncbi:hypothetical protein MYCTH_2124482 [Thermothelomyces thermophilus ATCC 42464]|uniref:Uncharacterized protein n=1 Tax=Thermothelomyces thermophilus (strain ATCC 42464 / BCRC 31852 / DSM 1799) TaxID=573729 RepID=G2Q661_THET4|nr:uncharacterized protein MYCTH_2124482 [Thermothelomyces thermophilus ATCC 42464]AEO55540.1 hypothetical protein MYCTH_2124482 [Thermothelomyces thermophilus ATCC 42464]